MYLLALPIFKDSSWSCPWWRGFSKTCPPSPGGQLNMRTLEAGGRVVLGEHLESDTITPCYGRYLGMLEHIKAHHRQKKLNFSVFFCFVLFCFCFCFFSTVSPIWGIFLILFSSFFAEYFVWKCSKQWGEKSTWTNGLICLVSIFPSCLWHLIVQKSAIFAILCWPKQEL